MDRGEHQERLVDGVHRLVMDPSADEISAFYDRHPYPPRVVGLTKGTAAADANHRRVEHHRMWPALPYRDDYTILVAGCGTSQAARWALRYPGSHVFGIDVSTVGIEEHRRLVRHHGIDNLEPHLLPLEQAGELGESFDLIVCTGVLHHLADPSRGLASLRDVLAPTGAIQLMVYATYGRVGVAMIREYCRRLGVDTSAEELADLVASLSELPLGHPLSHLLRQTPDFQDDDALADALLNPRERSYTVQELLALIGETGLRFGRWFRQAPYLPHCGVLNEIPHGPRIAALDETDQYAAVELFRGTITRHSAIVHRTDAPEALAVLPWDDPSAVRDLIPIRSTSATAVQERLPPGAAAVLLNRAHTHRDLVLFVDEHQRRLFEAIDGRRTIGEISSEQDMGFFRRLWWHDLIVVDASGTVQVAT